MKRFLLWTVVVVVIAVGVGAFVVWATQPTTTQTTYTPVGITNARLMSTTALTPKQRYCRRHPRQCLTYTRQTYSFKPLTAPDAETHCWAMSGRTESGNRLIDDVVDGTATFHGCIGTNPTRFSKVWITWDHHDTWLWTFDGMRVVDSHTSWCNACFGEQHHWQLQFSWHKGVNFFGQELYYHHTNYLDCTLRTMAYVYGRWTCG